MTELTKLKNKSFTVYLELRNIKRSPNKDKNGKYRYSFDIYIEGRLKDKNSYIRAKNIDNIIYLLKRHGIKTIQLYHL